MENEKTMLFEALLEFILRSYGYYVADNMNTESSVKALNMAIKQRKSKACDSSFRQRLQYLLRMITKTL
jgi:hypothetical protein